MIAVPDVAEADVTNDRKKAHYLLIVPVRAESPVRSSRQRKQAKRSWRNPSRRGDLNDFKLEDLPWPAFPACFWYCRRSCFCRCSRCRRETQDPNARRDGADARRHRAGHHGLLAGGSGSVSSGGLTHAVRQDRPQGEATTFARHGYVFVAGYRGRFKSKGHHAIDLSQRRRQDPHDGHDTLRWISGVAVV